MPEKYEGFLKYIFFPVVGGRPLVLKTCGVVCWRVEVFVGAKPGHGLEAGAAGASPTQSQPCCLLGTGPRTWPLPNLAQAGFRKV